VTGAKVRRQQLRISKKALAARVGLSVYDLSRMENGSVVPPVATIARIALLLGADPRTLFELHPCGCGCGTLIPKERTFAHGHDNTKGEQARRVWQERRRQTGIPETKVCEGCGRTYTRRLRENTRKWTKRRWCSKECWQASPICHFPPHQRSWT
jgi:transcriptional regulator with XRE-family HTH domain